MNYSPVVRLVGHPSDTIKCKFPEHRPGLLVSASADGQVCFWNLSDSSMVGLSDSFNSGGTSSAELTDLVVNDNGSMVISVFDSAGLAICDVGRSRSVVRSPLRGPGVASGLRATCAVGHFDYHCASVFVGFSSGQLSLYDLRNLSRDVTSCQGHEKGAVLSISKSRDEGESSCIVTTGCDGSIIVRSRRTLECLKTYHPVGSYGLDGPKNGTFSPSASCYAEIQSRYGLVGLGMDGVLRHWPIVRSYDPLTGQGKENTLAESPPHLEDDPIQTSYVVSNERLRTMKNFAIPGSSSTGQFECIIPNDDGGLTAMSAGTPMSVDGLMVAARSSKPYQISVSHSRHRAHMSPALCVAYDNRTKLVATGASSPDASVVVWAKAGDDFVVDEPIQYDCVPPLMRT